MSASSDSSPAVAASTAAPTNSQLPTELWKKIVLHLCNDDLKSARLVNSTFNDLSTPLLFRKVVLSIHKRNVMNLQQLERVPELRKHVQEVHIDLGSYASTANWSITNLRAYAENLERHFIGVLSLPPQCHGPLSVDNLTTVLSNELGQPLGPEYLTMGSLAQLEREGHRFQEIFQRCLEAFENIHHVETVTQWTERESSSIEFASYLLRHLPDETIEDIPGFQRTSTAPATATSASIGLYVAPGATARALDFMSLPPGPALNGSSADPSTLTLVQSILRTLSDKEIKLQSLSLPGSNAFGFPTMPRKRWGMIASPAFVSVEAGPNATNKNLLLPTFRHLKSLELHIDPISDVRIRHDLIDFSAKRLRQALQAMPLIETLSLGFSTLSQPGQNNVVPSYYGWTLHDTLLLRDSEDEEAMMAAHMFDRFNGDPLVIVEHLQALASTLEPGAEGVLVNPFTGQEIDVEPGVDFHEAVGIAPRPLSAGIPMRKRCKCWGSDPESAVQPNPWPKLKHLSLWNMPTIKADLVRLIKTVSPSLRSLELANVHLAKTTRSADEAETLYNHSVGRGLNATKQPQAGHEPFLGEVWLDVVEVMAQTLKLESCQLELGVADNLSVVEKLRGLIGGLEGLDTLVDTLLSKYLLDGEDGGIRGPVLRLRRSASGVFNLDDEESTEDENDVENGGVEPHQDAGKKTSGKKKNKKKKKGKKGKKR